jgi:hypothetical protein
MVGLFHDSDKGNMIYKVDVEEKITFLFGKITLCTEEAAVQRLGTGTVDGCQKASLIVSP